MVDVNALKGEIKKQGRTQKDVYESLGMTKRQWEKRMSLGRLDSNEIYALCREIPISNDLVMPIFFMGLK